MHASLFDEVLRAPDRYAAPGVRPIVSFRDDDEPAYLQSIERFVRARYALERRGRWHGSWAELDPKRLQLDWPTGRKLRIERHRRWHAAEPVLLPGAVPSAVLKEHRKRLGAAMRLGERLADPAQLHAWLRDVSDRLGPDASAPQLAETLVDPERDLAKVELDSEAGRLWLKTARLSGHPDDASVRLRFGFGLEGPDDASSHPDRHARLQRLAEGILPEATWTSEATAELLERFCGRPTRFTQHIAYWNHPQGGALFHHDSFDEDPADRQLGVCFVQLMGRTAWLALAIETLADRVREFAELLDEGELDWVSAELMEAGLSLVDLNGLCADRAALLAELAEPGCRNLSPLVNQGPEFTSFLADAGHAVVLQPGDALLLPNHTLSATAMHSVFCASPRPTYALSMAIRAAGPLKVSAGETELPESEDSAPAAQAEDPARPEE